MFHPPTVSFVNRLKGIERPRPPKFRVFINDEITLDYWIWEGNQDPQHVWTKGKLPRRNVPQVFPGAEKWNPADPRFPLNSDLEAARGSHLWDKVWRDRGFTHMCWIQHSGSRLDTLPQLLY